MKCLFKLSTKAINGSEISTVSWDIVIGADGRKSETLLPDGEIIPHYVDDPAYLLISHMESVGKYNARILNGCEEYEK